MIISYFFHMILGWNNMPWMCSSPSNHNSLNSASNVSAIMYFMFCVKEGLVMSSRPVADKEQMLSWFHGFSQTRQVERVCKISYCFRMAEAEEKNNSCGTICLKYLLFIFNLLFWVSLCLSGLWVMFWSLFSIKYDIYNINHYLIKSEKWLKPP